MTLQQRIEEECRGLRLENLQQTQEKLTHKYRQASSPKLTLAEKKLYLLTRMPATYTVLHHLFQQVQDPIDTLLDLGAGPGTSAWAAQELFRLSTITCLEQDADFVAIGKRLAPSPAVRYVQANYQLTALTPHDLVVLSYTLGETAHPLAIVDKAWNATQKSLLIVEPGNPTGFSLIRTVRAHLLSLGAHMVAPCPHALPCPIPEGDWCHFSIRLPRTALHRQIKIGTLNFEDEKYSYVLVSRHPQPLPAARILRHPEHHSGHIRLTLCTQEGLKTKTFSRKQGNLYKSLSKSKWGDTI